jgi:hypothetical protein
LQEKHVFQRNRILYNNVPTFHYDQFHMIIMILNIEKYVDGCWAILSYEEKRVKTKRIFVGTNSMCPNCTAFANVTIIILLI